MQEATIAIAGIALMISILCFIISVMRVKKTTIKWKDDFTPQEDPDLEIWEPKLEPKTESAWNKNWGSKTKNVDPFEEVKRKRHEQFHDDIHIPHKTHTFLNKAEKDEIRSNYLADDSNLDRKAVASYYDISVSTLNRILKNES